MKKILTLAALLVFGGGFLIACQNAAPSVQSEAKNADNSAVKVDSPGRADDAPRITLADAKKDFDAGTAVFVDTRAASAYQNERIKGAINMPVEAAELRYKEIPTDKKIIAYCS